jgi:Spy/CpxP family protein refolding chaperone
MNGKRILSIIGALAITAGAAVAFAQIPAGFDPGGPDAAGGPGAFAGPGGPGGPHGPIDPRRLADYLQLTDAQRASARELFEAQRAKVRPLFEQQRALREQLDATLDDAAASDAAIGQIVKQLRANREAIEAAHEEAKASFAALLDDAQKAKLAQLESVMDGLGFGKRHGRGRRG